ncbi:MULTISPECIES: LysR family transcriptional regulator [unclassified Agarivorans]|uniref:LysR family transcriptional regulator n=1 Tax=unclassified Agarivorans TaxID=2636026 RepID=UPI003D7EAC8E
MALLANTPPLLEFDLLRSFVAIAESGSFTRAAKQVFRSPAAVSMQIKRLEETLGKSLFIREARLVRLTPEGELLLSYSRRLLKLNEQAVSQFIAPPIEGTVCFGSLTDMAVGILPMVLAQFARSHPAVAVNVIAGSSTELLQRLDREELDMALFTAGNIGQDPTRGEIVSTESLIWANRSGGLAAGKHPLPIAVASHGCCWRAMALEALDKQSIDYRIAYTCDFSAGMYAAMEADLAIAVMPQSHLRAPFVQVDGSHGLPKLGEYQLRFEHRKDLGSAGNVLASYIVDALKTQMV